MPLKIVRNDITKMHVDAIVNTANPKPKYEEGTDSAIYMAAGEEKLLAERRKIGFIEVGEARITPAFGLNAKYVVHTVGPVWIDGKHGENEKISRCYINSLQLAVDNKCESVAFPLISTGIYGYPKENSLQNAISVISEFLLYNEIMVYLVVYDRESFEISGKLFQDIDEFIDDNYVYEKSKMNICYDNQNRILEEQKIQLNEICCSDEEICGIEDYSKKIIAKPCNMSKRSLEDVMNHLGETFQEMLLRMIDEKGMTDVEVYKKANLSRKLFSKIRCNKDYRPTKRTAVALAVAMKLNLDETKDLLQRAGIALSPSSKFDLIIEYFINNKVYDIYTINIALFNYSQPTLGE